MISLPRATVISRGLKVAFFLALGLRLHWLRRRNRFSRRLPVFKCRFNVPCSVKHADDFDTV